MCWQRHDRSNWGSAEASWPRATGSDRGRSTVARRPDERVSDSDRHAVVDDLQRHTADGRLTLDEFEERVDEALRARTGADLDATLRDLPSMAPTTPRPHRRQRVPVRPGFLAISIVAVLLVLGQWWVLIPVGFFLFGGCGGHARHPVARRDDERDDSITYA
jgi:Domain of unknown function (DUF1707)